MACRCCRSCRRTRSSPILDPVAEFLKDESLGLARRQRRGCALSRGTFDPCFDLVPQQYEIYRLGQERFCAALQRLALRLRIAVGSDHDDRDVRPCRPRLGQQLKAAHPRHIDVRQDQDERTIARIGDALECGGGGLGKLYGEPASARSRRNCWRNSTSTSGSSSTTRCRQQLSLMAGARPGCRRNERQIPLSSDRRIQQRLGFFEIECIEALGRPCISLPMFALGERRLSRGRCKAGTQKTSSGSLPMLAAMRRASSRVSSSPEIARTPLPSGRER